MISSKHTLGAALMAMTFSTLVPAAAKAQSEFEIRPFAGALIPVGDQRDELKNGTMAGVSANYRLTRTLWLTGLVGWSDSQARLLNGEPNVDVYHYNIGTEFRPFDFTAGSNWRFRPFMGGGLGGRTYDTDANGLESQTNFTGYSALGLQIDYRVVGLRLEGRNYLSRSKGLTGDQDTKTRDDIGITAGLSFHF